TPAGGAPPAGAVAAGKEWVAWHAARKVQGTTYRMSSCANRVMVPPRPRTGTANVFAVKSLASSRIPGDGSCKLVVAVRLAGDAPCSVDGVGDVHEGAG